MLVTGCIRPTLCALQELDYQEFRMFAMACIDKQNEMEEKRAQQNGLRSLGCQIL